MHVQPAVTMEEMDNATAPNATLDNFEVNVPYTIFIPLLIAITTFMNLGTIVAFCKLPSLREKPSELLILNLACSDLLTGIWVLPLAAPLYITPDQWPFGEIGCAIWILAVDISLHGTLFALMTISIDRFLLVYLEYPQYIKNVTRQRVYKIIASGWILTFITAAIEMALWEEAKGLNDVAGGIDHSKHCLSPPRRVHSFALCFFLILYLFPVLIVCTLSIAFLYQLHLRLKKTRQSPHELKESSHGHSRSSDAQIMESTPENSQASLQGVFRPKPTRTRGHKSKSEAIVRRRYIKPGITLICLVSAMAVCMLPYSFYVIYSDIASSLGECERCSDPDIIYGLILMQFLNACFDPFIYVLTRKRMRIFYRTMYKRLLGIRTF